MFDNHVAENAGVVVIVGTTVLRLVIAGRTLGLDRTLGVCSQRETRLPARAGVAALVADAKAIDDDAAPLLDVLRTCSL